MSGDGSSQITANIDAPSNYYAEYASYALVNGKLFIFGGSTDGKKVLLFTLSLILPNFRSQDWTTVLWTSCRRDSTKDELITTQHCRSITEVKVRSPFQFRNLQELCSPDLLRLIFHVVRVFRRDNIHSVDVLSRLDSCFWRTCTVPQSAHECWLRRRISQQSGNAHVFRMGCSSRFSNVRFVRYISNFIIFQGPLYITTPSSV